MLIVRCTIGTFAQKQSPTPCFAVASPNRAAEVMSSVASHASARGRRVRGRVLIYVVGFNQSHWTLFPADCYHRKEASIVDVREDLPHDPDPKGGKGGKGQKGGKAGKGGKGARRPREPLVTQVVGQDGFQAAVERVVGTCLTHGGAICGFHSKSDRRCCSM